MRSSTFLIPLVALASLITAEAGATDRHTIPTISAVKRNAAGRVVKCKVECMLLETGRGQYARLSLHGKDQYKADLSKMSDTMRRQVIAGNSRSKKHKPLWVSDTITKKGQRTPVDLVIDFGSDGLPGSEDLKAEFILSSAHASTTFTTSTVPHVHAAPTAPMQQPEAGYYFTFARGTKVK